MGATAHAFWRIDGYEDRRARATEVVEGTVVATHVSRRYWDDVDVEWTDRAGRQVRRRFEVQSAGDFPVGTAFSRARAPGSDEVFEVATGDAADRALFVVVFGGIFVLWLQLAWLIRFVTWRRAARAQARPFEASLLLGGGQRSWVGVPWLRLTERDARGVARVRFQRVMWEPWLSGWQNPWVFPVTARQHGPGRPFVVDVPDHGRLWPAGRTRRREPFLEHLLAGSYDGTPPDRWPAQVLIFVAIGAISTLFTRVPPTGVLNPVLGLLVGGGVAVSLALLMGGSRSTADPVAHDPRCGLRATRPIVAGWVASRSFSVAGESLGRARSACCAP